MFTVLSFALLLAPQASIAQSATPTPAPQQTAGDQAPLTDRERALLDRIDKLEQRLNAIEQKGTGTAAPAEQFLRILQHWI